MSKMLTIPLAYCGHMLREMMVLLNSLVWLSAADFGHSSLVHSSIRFNIINITYFQIVADPEINSFILMKYHSLNLFSWSLSVLSCITSSH